MVIYIDHVRDGDQRRADRELVFPFSERPPSVRVLVMIQHQIFYIASKGQRFDVSLPVFTVQLQVLFAVFAAPLPQNVFGEGIVVKEGA
jgi:hypothetical protein